MVNISGLDKAEVLLALYNASHAQGMSFLQKPDAPVTINECRAAVYGGNDESVKAQLAGSNVTVIGHEPLYFDYWRGHVLKVNLSGDEFDPRLFDRDNYEGAAEAAIAKLRER